MKKHLINLRVIVFGSLLLFSKENLLGQTISNSQSPANAEICGSARLHDNLMQNDPAYAARSLSFEQYVQSINEGTTPKILAQYKIPVVIHVLHKGEAVGVGTNVSEDAIRRTIRELNNRYRKVAGTGGDGAGVDSEIEFVLAVRNPSGQCTNGINRVSMASNSTYMNYGVRADGSQGITDAQCKAVASWDRSKYYNIYLVSEIDNNEGGAGIQGYAYFASSHGQSNDGAVMLASNFTAGNSMTLTHELGHALNLYHTFEGDGSGSSCPPTTNGCGTGSGDCCADTPPHRRSQSNCNVTGTNSCNGNSSNSLFVRNYMDYSSDACVNMFTANQKTRMLAACSGPRASFFAASNQALVPVAAPVANFSASSAIICSGQSVTFTDLSSCVPNTYLGETSWAGTTFSWTFTNGSTVLTSSVQNPTMTFTVPGAYNVSLTVTTPAGTNTYTQNNAVVLGGTVVNACTPSSQNAGGYGQTVSNVVFNTINNSTSQLTNVGYTNFVCTNNTIVTAGTTYPLSVTVNAGPSGAERFEVYIDYNNDGVFANPSELVHSGSVSAGSSSALNTSTTSANVLIPSTAVTNTVLRMRVMGETGSTISAGKRTCSASFSIGDVEDYGVYISAPTSGGCTTAPSIATQPSAATICAGANTSFTVASTGASTYQWQVSTDGGTNWTNISNGGVYSTATTTALTITAATAGMSTYRYRCVTTNSCGSTNSSGVILTVNGLPAVSTQPSAATICAGANTSFTVAAASATSYQWQVSTNGGTTWTNVTNGGVYSTATTASLTITGATSAMSAYQYRCVVTNSCGSTNSSGVALTINGLPAISTQPAAATVCPGANASFTVAATGATSYQWQVSTNGGTTWTNVTNGGVYSTATTASLTITGATSGMSTYRYRCVTNNTCGATNSSGAILTVSSSPSISTQPAASTVCAGANTSFTVAASGATSYQWQVSTNGGTTWTNITNGGVYSTATTTALTITGATSAMSAYRYRCVATSSCGSSNSSGVVLTVNPAPTVTATTPGSRCGTGTVTLGATASAGTLTWYTASTGGTSIGTGTTVTTPSISSTTTYYVEATNGGCSSARTAVVATVTSSSVAATATATSICEGASTTITATGASTYSWDSGQSGASITVSPTITTTYTVTGVSSCSGSASVTVNVTPLPNTTFAALQPVCSYTPAFALSGGSPAGGTYSGTGVTGGNFNPSTAGAGTVTLTYTVTQNGCTKSATSLIEVNGCLGIEDQNAEDLLVLYPNPVEGWMTVEGKNLSEYASIELLDAAGRLVVSWKIDTDKMNLDLSGVASGHYTVVINGSEKQIVKKIEILK